MTSSMSFEDILKFWFEELQPNQWFNGGDAVDAEIEKRFEAVIEPLFSGELASWPTSPRGRLASIIVLDQFTRNIYRGTPRSFAYDRQALHWSLEGISQGWDTQLQPIERVFFYLPLEHSEVMEDQDLSMERFARLVTTVEASEKERFRQYLHYAWRHYEIIKQFDRYPHRNDILGRESTPEEVAFLKTPGSSFL